MTTPYTYLIKHIPTNTFYYGVRFRKNCHPQELWKTYFTSSVKIIPLLRTLFGDESFTYKVRQIFDNSQKARKWEEKVLRRMHVLENSNIWLNRTDQKSILNEINPQQGKVRPQYVRDAISNARIASKGMYCWVNNQIKEQRIKKIDLVEYTKNGWVAGRLGATAEKISSSRKGKFVGAKNHFYGKKHTTETKNKISAANKGKMTWKLRDPIKHKQNTRKGIESRKRKN